MSDSVDIRATFDTIHALCRTWSDAMQSGQFGDSGSYCETPDKSFQDAFRVFRLLDELRTALIAMETQS